MEFSPIRSRRLSWLLGALTLGLVLALWLLVDWAWSTIDDPGHVQLLRDHVREFGPLGGSVARANDMFEIDLEWGLFRPMYWLYAATFYWLPLPLAHVARLLMLIVAVAGPAIYFSRQNKDWNRRAISLVIVLGGSSTLILGLFYVSLQELSGAAFVGLGLLFRNRIARLVSWLLAAWFKAPFAWLLVGYSLVLWRQGRRREALVSALLGFGTLAMAVLMARQGSYTSTYTLDPFIMWDNIPKLFERQNSYLLLMVLWWAVVAARKVSISQDTLLFGTAFAGYTLQLLPWSVTAYYGGPISYFMSLTLVSVLGTGIAISRLRAAVALSLPILLATLLVAWPMRQVFETNTAVRGILDCLAGFPGSKTALLGNQVYVTTSPEAPIRLMASIRLEYPEWTGEIILIDSATLQSQSTDFTHIAVVGQPGTFQGLPGTAVCETGIARVYKLK